MKTLEIYQKRLTNLSAKNRSLVLLRLLQGQFMDLHELDFVLNEPSFRILERLIARRIKTKICTTLDSRGKSGNQASRQLRKIARTDRFIEEERGAKDLYVGYPFVRGKMLDDTIVRAPLLFFPVELREEDNHWMLYSRQDVPISFNKTLLLAFSHYNAIQFDDDFLNQNFEDFSKEAKPFLTELYNQLKDSSLEINFNQANFEEKLQDFQVFTKAKFEEETRTGELKAYPEAVLGIFPQAGSYLMPDYDTLLAAQKIQDIEEFFHPSAQLKDDPDVHDLVLAKAAEEESLTTPYDLDAAQEQAIKAIKAGDSLVVQGPPGSGKSQLICNLVTDFIARGKNVLVVCQKKAALDVVYDRLDQKSFADFTALVHDFRNDRKDIYQRIHRNIEAIPEFISQNNSLDSIYLERNFLKYSREIDQLTEELEEFKHALFDVSECGVSVKELYLNTERAIPYVKLRQEYKNFPSAEAPGFIKKLRAYASYANTLKQPNHPWVERVSFKGFGVADLTPIKEALAEVKPYRDEIAGYVKELIAMDVNLDECIWILDREDQFRKLLDLLENDTVLRYFKNTLKYTNVEKIWLANRKQNVLGAFGEVGVEKTLTQKQLNNAVKAVDKAIVAQKKWTERTKWKLFSKDKTFVHDLMINNKMEDNDDALYLLMQMIENRMNLEHHLSALEGSDWLIEQPEDYSKDSYDAWFSHHIQAAEARDIYVALRNGIKYLAIEDLTYQEIKDQILTLLTIVKNVPYQKLRWQKYLSNKQIKDLEEGKRPADQMIDSLEKDFDALIEFDELVLTIEPFEMEIIDKLYDQTQVWDADKLIPLFENSLKIAWVNHIEAKYPILKSVSTPKLQLLEDQLQEAMEAKQDVCEQIVLMNARERVYKEVEYNRLNNRVTYRDLQHQVNKKRSIWPLRKLIDNFSHELLDLIPCWMASPESVSAIFPMEKLFDLVIFDEASQCFAEKGIPAMYRGKQVIIVGDSQQLPPYDLYHPRWEEDLEDPALEVDSLLDLGCRYLPETTLTGHYRSQSLALIDFSNAHFYAGKLRMLPSKAEFLSDDPAIQYLHVKGIWEKNTNLIEAQQVVHLVTGLIAQEKTNIGVITFNFKQQDLIRDLLEQENINIPPDIFIKNIENVQGDERDIIIFSIGYAPGPSGRMRVQFGSLNLTKGENRLNVAITRARTKVYVVSSILPHELNVSQTKNAGPKLLKEYLQYAYDVSEGKYKPIPKPLNKFENTWFLKHRIKQLTDGKVVLRSDLPFADLALTEPDRTALIMTDDDLFHQSLSAKDAFAYTPFLLKSKGWSFKRFYSRVFWRQHDEFVDAYRKFVGM